MSNNTEDKLNSEHLLQSLEQFIKFTLDITRAIKLHDDKIKAETSEWVRKNEAEYWIEACEAVVPDKVNLIKEFRKEIENAIYNDDEQDDE